MLVKRGAAEYEVNLSADCVNLYRCVPEDEYRQWYVGDERIAGPEGARRLFLKRIPREEAAETLVRNYLEEATT